MNCAHVKIEDTMINKKTVTDVFLTKEAFNEYAKRLREEQAREYGMTLEQWDDAILNGQTISPNTQPTSSLPNKP